MNKGLTKMGDDKSGENTPNAPKFICPSPKVWDFNKKRLHWVSVVRGIPDQIGNQMLHMICNEHKGENNGRILTHCH